MTVTSRSDLRLRRRAVGRTPSPVLEGMRAWVTAHESIDTLVVITVVVLAYAPYLIGLVLPGVFGFNSGLATVPLGPDMGHQVGLPWIDPNVGYVSQALGHLSAVTVLHGHIPWWNPFEGVGAPLAGEGQSAALFPLSPLLALPNGQLYFHLTLQLIAGIATQRLLREMGVSRWVSLVGGVLFGLNGTFAWLTNAAFNPVAFLPVVLWGVERCRRRPFNESWSGWLLIAVGLAGSAYAGFPETAYLDGALALCWAVLRWAQEPRGERARYAATVGIGAGVGALVSAPFLAAFDAATRNADIGGHAANFAGSHLPASALNTIGLPYLFGPISAFSTQDHTGALNAVWGTVGGYVTAALLCIALYGLFAGRDRALRFLLGGWLLVTVARAFGFAPVTTVLRLIPGEHALAFGRYSPPSWELAAVVLASVGLETFTTRRARSRTQAQGYRPNLRAFAIAALCSLAVAGLAVFEGRQILHSLAHAPNFTRFAQDAAVYAVASVVLVVAVGVVTNAPVARVAIGLVLVVDALAMFMVPQLSAPASISVDMAPVTFLQTHLGMGRFATLGPIAPNYGSEFGIAEVNAHDLPTPGPWATYVATHLEPNERPQQFDGVSSLDPRGPTALDELRTHLSSYEDIGVRYVVAPTVWGQIVGRRVFRDRYTSIFELPRTTPYFHTASGTCSLHPLSRTEVRADCSTPSVIVRQELDAAGWSASAGGQAVTVSHYGPLFMAVHLPAGRTVLTFSYQPPHTQAAGALALAGVALGIGAAVVPVSRRRRDRRRRRTVNGEGYGPAALAPGAASPTRNGGDAGSAGVRADDWQVWPVAGGGPPPVSDWQ